MQNVVSFGTGRRRPHGVPGVPRGGACILFFTGVRYCRDEGAAQNRIEGAAAASQPAMSDRVLDAAAH